MPLYAAILDLRKPTTSAVTPPLTPPVKKADTTDPISSPEDPFIEGQLWGRSTVAKSSTILEMSYTHFVGALSMSRCSLGSQGFPWVFGGAPRASLTGFGGCRFRGVISCAH